MRPLRAEKRKMVGKPKEKAMLKEITKPNVDA